ncbi:MAG: hypothetical protein DWQ04_32495 [Chloroflexi bacterium]|nr:MAG: hypothetical protein DWQ04_32495 [Chloroflexota bacterium]
MDEESWENGRFPNNHRIEYLKYYLAELEKAINAGSDMRAYFVYSTTNLIESLVL